MAAKCNNCVELQSQENMPLWCIILRKCWIRRSKDLSRSEIAGLLSTH